MKVAYMCTKCGKILKGFQSEWCLMKVGEENSLYLCPECFEKLSLNTPEIK